MLLVKPANLSDSGVLVQPLLIAMQTDKIVKTLVLNKVLILCLLWVV